MGNAIDLYEVEWEDEEKAIVILPVAAFLFHRGNL